MGLQLSVAQASAIGPREENQDALRLVTPAPELAACKGYLFALADGVSHCADGGLAARATLQALAMDYYSTPATWGVAQALERLLLAQNRWLRANGGGQPLLTTLTALVLRGRRFTLAHVGDCRAYRWHAGQLQRLSQDHVWDQPGMQHVLKRALGLDEHLLVDFLEGELQAGECYVLLSDGVWASLNEQQIAAHLREQPDLDQVAQTLVSAAHHAGSQDNASALLVRIEEPGAANLGYRLAQLQDWPLPPSLRPGQVIDGWTVDSLLAHSRQATGFSLGLSPRAGLGQVASARAWALLAGRDHVQPEDVQAVLPAVAGHRLRSDGDRRTSPEERVRRLLEAVPLP